MELKSVVNRLSQLPNVLIDRGYLQGRDAVLEQLRTHRGEDVPWKVDDFLIELYSAIDTLAKMTAPYRLPDEYLDFLRLYGGMLIRGADYSLATVGIGPMVEEWYRSILSEDALDLPGKYGFVSIGLLSFDMGHKFELQRVDFFLDLAGKVQEQCVIGLGPTKKATDSFRIVSDIEAHPGTWKICADSFTQWLDRAGETNGVFSYQ